MLENKTGPAGREGEECTICGKWLCQSCIDHRYSGDHGCVCKKCKDKYNFNNYNEAEKYIVNNILN